MNGYLNILKPPGMSSAAVVATVKRLTGERRVGHAGTLDPEAAGVLPVMVGQATRFFDLLTDKEKVYVAECAFGCETDTQDAQGRVTARGDTYPTLAQIRAAADALTGDILQRPGIYSAVKRDGKRLYALARAGEAVEATPRPVHIERITLHGETPRHGVMMTVACGRGTYIRSLCEDLGRLCGCPAHMRFLLRAVSGAFSLENAMTLEEAAACASNGTLPERLLPPDMPLGHLAAVRLPEEQWKPARNGVALPADDDRPEGEPLRVYAGDAFIGIACREADLLKWRIVINER